MDAQGEWEAAMAGVGESGRWQSEPLVRTDAFDGCIWHPVVLPLLERLLGPTLRLIGMSAMSRDPVGEAVPQARGGAHWQLFHREEGASFAPEHPFCMRTSMVLYCESSSRTSGMLSLQMQLYHAVTVLHPCRRRRSRRLRRG